MLLFSSGLQWVWQHADRRCSGAQALLADVCAVFRRLRGTDDYAPPEVLRARYGVRESSRSTALECES